MTTTAPVLRRGRDERPDGAAGEASRAPRHATGRSGSAAEHRTGRSGSAAEHCGGRPFPERARHAIGGFYLSMGGVHLGIVAADPQLYRDFAARSPFAVVRDGWADIVMANPASWGLLLFAGETVIGLLLLSRGRPARLGWALVVAFHLLLCLFGAWALVWTLPVLAVVVPLALRDRPATAVSVLRERNPR
ncbi:MAG: hypothetical protein ACRCZD_01245 [Phycicoccus sp.]